jgi:GGDEF domain-containing protein
LITQKIIDDVEKTIFTERHQIVLSASIGIARSDDPDYIEQKLLSVADSAMYQAKKQGIGNIVWIDDATDAGLGWVADEWLEVALQF